MGCCVGCCRILLVLLSVLLLLIGFSLACLVLWLRFDDNFEHQLRQTLLANPTKGAPELVEMKSGFGQAYLTIFWTLTSFGLIFALIGFFGIWAASLQKKSINALLCTLLLLLIIFQVLLFLSIAWYQNSIFDRLSNYMSTSFQYNLQDAIVLQNRFGCCGDGNAQASYNYQCTGMNQPNCRQILEQWLGLVLAGIGISIACMVALELLALILSSVLICHRKYDPAVEDVPH